MKRVSDEIFFCDSPTVTVDREQIDFLAAQARRNPSGKSRLCAHSTVEDALHEMLIVHAREAYIRPHRHLARTESLHVVEGAADVFLFDENGAIRQIIPLAEATTGRAFFFRLAEPTFHTLRIHSPHLVFHEATTGPFRKSATEYASWSPTGPAGDDVKTWLAWLDGPRKIGDRPPG